MIISAFIGVLSAFIGAVILVTERVEKCFPDGVSRYFRYFFSLYAPVKLNPPVNVVQNILFSKIHKSNNRTVNPLYVIEGDALVCGKNRHLNVLDDIIRKEHLAGVCQMITFR